MSSFYVFKAGAGSGKTFNLVKQYLMMAFNAKSDDGLRQQFRSILAITFTNKAANEMKERIWNHLDDMAQGRDSGGMAAQISKEMGITVSELTRRAAVVSRAMLHNYSDLSVCTIDSFMQRIVRTFAHDLNVAGNFGIELDSKYVISFIVDQLMAQAGTAGHEAFTQMLCEYGTAQMNDAKSNNIENALSTTAQRLFSEDAEEYLVLLRKHDFPAFIEAAGKLRSDNEKYLQRCRTLADKALMDCKEKGLDEKDFPGGKTRSVYAWLNKMKKDGSEVKLNGEAQKVLTCRVLSADAKKAQHLAAVQRSVMAAVDGVAAGINDYNTRRMLLANYYNVAMLSEMKRLRDDYYHDNEVIDLVEVGHKISNEVKDQPAPFLFERLGERYRHFLVDEFQDTSKEQWHNLLPLILNGVSEGQRSMVVGDAKQAIYRFRQGDVHQFLKLSHDEDGGPHAEHSLLDQRGVTEVVPLKVNYRTRKEVVEFNNRFFAWLITGHYADNALLQSIYHGHEQQHVKEEGYVELSFWQHDKGVTGLDGLYKEASRIIQQQHAKGYKLSDITVLAGDKQTLSGFAAYLSVMEPPVRSSSSDSMLLVRSMAVRLLQALLHYLLNATERVVQLQVLEYLRRLDILQADYVPLFFRRQAAGEHERYAFNLVDYLQQQGFDFNPRRLKSLSLYGCCEELIRCFHLGEKDEAFVASFLDFMARYSRSHRQDLGEFLDYFEEKKEGLSANAAADDGTVRLMTVHKSKGLESPVVIYLVPDKRHPTSTQWVHVDDKLSAIEVGLVSFAKDKTSAFDAVNSREQQEEQMDDVNRTYVALTRAKDKLFLVVEEKKTATAAASKTAKTPSDAQASSSADSKGDSLNRQLRDFAAAQAATGYCRNKDEKDDVDGCCFGNDHVVENLAAGSAMDNGEWQEEALGSLCFAPWEGRLRVAPQGSTLLDGLPDESIRRGLQMHELLSQVRYAGDEEEVLHHYAALHGIAADEQALLLRQLRAVVQGADTARFFAPGMEVKNECALWYEGRELRPDRVVVMPQATWVIDFKTGVASEEHHGQVARYCRAVAAMGYRAVAGCIVYMGSGVHVVPVAWADNDITQIAL